MGTEKPADEIEMKPAEVYDYYFGWRPVRISIHASVLAITYEVGA